MSTHTEFTLQPWGQYEELCSYVEIPWDANLCG